MKKYLLVFGLLSLFLTAKAQDPSSIRVISWNIESGGMNDQTIAEQIRNAQDVGLWGISEMPNSNSLAELFEESAEDGENANFEAILGSTGGHDRLLIIYDADRFELVNVEELSEINIDNSGRAPLVAHLALKDTEVEFFFMVNHLFRGNSSKRHRQSRMLNEWAEMANLPVIAVGDYNYDWEVNAGDSDHDLGYDLLTAGNIFQWVRPDELIRTQCSATSSGGCRYNSVLDFVFTANIPDDWEAESRIIVQPGDFPDDSNTSDHRMIQGTFEVATMPSADCSTIKMRLLEHIEKVEAELEIMRALLDELEGEVGN